MLYLEPGAQQSVTVVVGKAQSVHLAAGHSADLAHRGEIAFSGLIVATLGHDVHGVALVVEKAAQLQEVEDDKIKPWLLRWWRAT